LVPPDFKEIFIEEEEEEEDTLIIANSDLDVPH
jgi:hypothetical protein